MVTPGWGQDADNQKKQAQPDSIQIPRELETHELRVIAFKQVEGGQIKRFSKEIVDGVSFYRALVESDREIATMWLDPYSGKVRKIVREERKLAPTETNRAKEDVPQTADYEPIDRHTAEIIATAQLEKDAKAELIRQIEYKGQTYYEVVIRERVIGADKQTFWIETQNGTVSAPLDDARHQHGQQKKARIDQKLSDEIKISRDDAKKKVLERVPGRIIATDIRKKGGTPYYYFQVLTDDKQVKKVRFDAVDGDLMIAK